MSLDKEKEAFYRFTYKGDQSILDLALKTIDKYALAAFIIVEHEGLPNEHFHAHIMLKVGVKAFKVAMSTAFKNERPDIIPPGHVGLGNEYHSAKNWNSVVGGHRYMCKGTGRGEPPRCLRNDLAVDLAAENEACYEARKTFGKNPPKTHPKILDILQEWYDTQTAGSVEHRMLTHDGHKHVWIQLMEYAWRWKGRNNQSFSKMHTTDAVRSFMAKIADASHNDEFFSDRLNSWVEQEYRDGWKQ